MSINNQAGSTLDCIRPSELAEKLCINRSTLYKLEKEDPDFPKKIMLGKRMVMYRVQEVNDYIESKRKAQI